MEPQRELVQQLFEAARALDPSKRSQFLNRVCEGKPEVLPVVQGLLSADKHAASDLAEPLLRGANCLEATTAASGEWHPQPGQDSRITFAPGHILNGRYAVVRFIAKGGMGEVYEVEDRFLQNQHLALKTIRRDLAEDVAWRQRFEREVVLARKVVHPNLCPIYNIERSDPLENENVTYLTMKLLEGETLAARLCRDEAMPPDEKIAVLKQLCDGVSAIHKAGIIHRDIKPNNVMLQGKGPDVAVCITDFGLARERDSDTLLSGKGLIAGTPDYIAPEVLSGHSLSQASDLFALGVVAHQIFTGEKPGRSAAGQVPIASPALRQKGTPEAVAQLIEGCLSEDPQKRTEAFAGFSHTIGVGSGISPLSPRRLASRHLLWLAIPLLMIPLGIIAANRYLFVSAGPGGSLAVLPLTNRTGDSKLDFLASGIREALTNDLSRSRGLDVKAESVTRRFAGSNIDPQSAGRTLHVKSVVNGSITFADQSLHVLIELVDVKTGRQVWGKTYEGTLSELASLQSQISTDVAYKLKLKFDSDARERFKRQYATSSAAYTFYLKGRYHLAERSPEALQEAIIDFQRSLDQDPEYAPGYAGLADTYTLLGYYRMEQPIPLFQKAIAAAQHALELDSTLGEAYVSRAAVRIFLNFDWSGAEQDYRRAIELNPNYLQGHTWFALSVLIPTRRMTEAAAQLNYAESADPDSPVTLFSLAMLNYTSGNYDKVVALLGPRCREAAQFESGCKLLVYSLLFKERYEDVIRLLEAPPADHEMAVSCSELLGIAYARSGQRMKALAKLKIAEAGFKEGRFISFQTALLETALGRNNQALDMLEVAYARREPDVIFAPVDPMLIPLHSEPRFARLLDKMKLGS